MGSRQRGRCLGSPLTSCMFVTQALDPAQRSGFSSAWSLFRFSTDFLYVCYSGSGSSTEKWGSRQRGRCLGSLLTSCMFVIQALDPAQRSGFSSVWSLFRFSTDFLCVCYFRLWIQHREVGSRQRGRCLGSPLSSCMFVIQALDPAQRSGFSSAWSLFRFSTDFLYVCYSGSGSSTEKWVLVSAVVV